VKLLLTLLVVILAGAPAAAQQSRLYTNADLGKTRVAWSRTVTPEELRGLAAREFVLPPQRPAGPTVVILPDTPRFAPFEPTRPLSEPWSMTTYLGHRGRGFRRSSPGPGIHLQYP
jgi:hypothetical protein